ncbi:MAG: hypothetical protein RL235_1039 [Chlamydiota bacterium]|jgi:membrane protein YqaA with SNARE-associated domain
MQAASAKLYRWATEKANAKHAPLWVGIIFFLELILFMPMDAVLMFFCLQNRSRALWYVLIAALASMLSALCGYLIGHFLWDLIGDYIVPHFISHHAFDRIAGHFQQYEHWAVFLGSFLPLPLKALSLSAGVFELGALQFIAWVGLARLFRFMIVGGSMILWGETVKTFVDRHFHRILVAIGAKVVAISLFVWLMAR